MFYHRKNPACGSSAWMQPVNPATKSAQNAEACVGAGPHVRGHPKSGKHLSFRWSVPRSQALWGSANGNADVFVVSSGSDERALQTRMGTRGPSRHLCFGVNLAHRRWRAKPIAARPPPGPVPKAQPASPCGLGPRKAGETVNFNKLTELLRTKSQITWSLRAAVIAWEFKGSCRSPRVWRHRQRGTRAQSGRGGTPTGASPLPQCRLPPSVHSRILNSSTT